MTVADVLLQDFETEIANTRRTIERVPEDKAAWVPHPKSMPMGKLAMHCANLPLFGHYIIEDDGMDMAAPTRPRIPLIFEGRDASLAHLADAAAKCRASLATASDDHLLKLWPFTYGEQVISTRPGPWPFAGCSSTT